ncbi:MAG TPA: porin [Verrucomicrobiae bacterium]|jgi:phosphate-selective porin OprO/OprP
MKLKWLLLTAVVGAQSGITALGQDTNSSSADIDALKQEVQALEQKVNTLEQQQAAQGSSAQSPETAQVQDLDQKVRVLQRQHELDQQAAADAAKAQPKIALNANGFSFSSADSNFVAQLHGVIQVDSRSFFNDGGGTLGKNTFLVRRARPIFTGTVFHDFDFVFIPDFGGSGPVIYDAYVNYHYSPGFQVEAGRFKSPVGLESLQQDVWTTFNERSLVTDLVPNRDIGFELHGDVFSGRASYAAAILNGAPDYITPVAPAQDVDDDKAFAGRIFLQPFKTSDEAFLQGFGFGVGGSYEDDRRTAADLTTGYKTDGQQSFYTYAANIVANGAHWRIAPQGYYYYGPFSLLGEYAISDQQVSKTTAPVASAEIRNKAWEITAGWVLTGENATYNGITPRHPFDPRNGQWGAWQLVARYADLNIDKDAFPTFASAGSASEAAAWSAGINWFLNRDIRIDASFSRTTFSGGGGTAGQGPITAKPENVLFTRLQLGF